MHYMFESYKCTHLFRNLSNQGKSNHNLSSYQNSAEKYSYIKLLKHVFILYQTSTVVYKIVGVHDISIYVRNM